MGSLSLDNKDLHTGSLSGSFQSPYFRQPLDENTYSRSLSSSLLISGPVPPTSPANDSKLVVDVEYDLLQYGAGSEEKFLDVVYSRCEIVRQHFKHILHFFQSQKVLRRVDIVFIFDRVKKNSSSHPSWIDKFFGHNLQIFSSLGLGILSCIMELQRLLCKAV